jgi:hypothetical protein
MLSVLIFPPLCSRFEFPLPNQPHVSELCGGGCQDWFPAEIHPLDVAQGEEPSACGNDAKFLFVAS